MSSSSSDSSDSEYNVDLYFNPTVKRTTYNNDDDAYLSEHGDFDESDEENKKQETDSENEGKEGGTDENESEGMEITEESQCILNKKSKQTINQGAQKKEEIEENEEEPIRTNNRFILHVSNLSETISKQMLEIFFSEAGDLKSVRMPRNRKIAFIEFKNLISLKVNFCKIFFKKCLVSKSFYSSL